MHIYFMGICGTAMGNVALLLKELGHTISGCDQTTYPPMADSLRAAQIHIFEGFDADRLAKLNPDLVVVGNIISRGNLEIEWLLNTRTFKYISLPQLIHEYLLKTRSTIVITGTHGKTTTASMCAHLLTACTIESGYLIGGIPLNFETGSHLGSDSAPFVIEGDEYDSAFFDKRSKFIHYNPYILVINNIEFDHADIFRDLEDVKRSFSHLLRLVPQNGYLIYNGDDAVISSLLPVNWIKNQVSIGIGPHNNWQILAYELKGQISTFELWHSGQHVAKLSNPLGGIYNARNAAMALVASHLANPKLATFDKLSEELYTFKGIKRRQTVVYQDAIHLVIEDFAHHPTAIQATLAHLKNRYPEHTVLSCFEPKSNTLRSNVFQKSLHTALSNSDRVWMTQVDTKLTINRLDTQALVDKLIASKVEGRLYNNTAELLSALVSEIFDRPHLICFFSNASFDGIVAQYVNYLEG